MKEKLNFLYKQIEDKTIVWSKHNNEYLVLENTTAFVLEKLGNGITIAEIAKDLSDDINVPLEKAVTFVEDLKRKFYIDNILEETKPLVHDTNLKESTNFEFTKCYKINELIITVAYASEFELYLVHPKFAHLEMQEAKSTTNTFSVFTSNKLLYFYVNHVFIGAWPQEEIHYFQGKFSMELIQKIHKKQESEWLGVFHASAVSNGKKSILFLGDSGNGKSTSLALLQANGFTCLADDFVPISAANKEVYSFPAAISIKKNSLETLLPLYPALENSAEYHFKRLHKIVRYLKPNNTDFLSHLPCTDLVFIKYNKNSDINVLKISKIAAFQQLVPDSWLSPIKENAQLFLDWFSTLNCYQITYSDNKKMITTVSKIFNDDL